MIKRVFLRSILFCIVSLAFLTVFSQKKFTLTITLPNGLDAEKLEAYLDNGKNNVKIDAKEKSKNKVLFTGEYYSIYAILNLQYKKGTDGTSGVFGNTFFVNEKPASISFSQTDTAISPLDKYSLTNVKDFKKEKQQMADCDSAERRKAIEYEILYGDKISAKYPEIRDYYFDVLRKAQGRKKLHYIIANADSYYSFYSFRSDVAWPLILPTDSLMDILDSVFPDNFRLSDEGNYLKEYLLGRTKRTGDLNSIDFTSKDINGKKVTLSEFKNQKNVLLHFWATWCSPCISEMPLIKEISNQYGQKDLQIISIALKSSYGDFLGATKKYQMDWINIYNDADLLYKYGNYPVPRICVIDKSGKLIYDSHGVTKNEDPRLSKLNQVLKSLVN